MCNARVCPICGMWFKDCFTLYRHHVDVHRRRFCWYCAFEEGKPSRMRRHVAAEHPTVCLDMDERVWRNEMETLREVPASFPTSPGYVPYREEDLQQPFPFPFVYIPTPKDLCPRGPDSRPDQAKPAAEATEAAAAAVGASPAQEVSDWEDMGVEIVIEEEATEDGRPILRQQRVVSVQPVDDEIPGPNDTRTIQCAARDLLATAGLKDIAEEDELQQDPLACLQALTRKVWAALGHATPSPCPATEDPSRKKPRMSGEEHSSLASASSTTPSVPSVPEETMLLHFPHAPPTPPPQVPSSSSPSAPVLVHVAPAPPPLLHLFPRLRQCLQWWCILLRLLPLLRHRQPPALRQYLWCLPRLHLAVLRRSPLLQLSPPVFLPQCAIHGSLTVLWLPLRRL